MSVNSSCNYGRDDLVIGATTKEGVFMTLMVKPHSGETPHLSCRLVTSFPSLIENRRNEDIHNFYVRDTFSITETVNHITTAIDCRIIPGLSASEACKEMCRIIRKEKEVLTGTTPWPRAESDQGSLLD
jgi:hypothetical protein